MCNQQGIVAVADVARRELEEIARAEQHIDDDDDADADGDEMVPIDPDERDADEDDDDGGGAGGAQQATEKDNHVHVLLEDSQTREALRFVFKGRTWEKVGTPSAPPNQHGAVENETGATASPPVVTPEAAQGVSPDSNVSTNGAVTLQTVVQDRTRSRVAPSLTPLAPRGLEASFTESAQAVPHSAQNVNSEGRRRNPARSARPGHPDVLSRDEARFPEGRNPLEDIDPLELWGHFVTDEMLQLAVESTNKRVEHLDLMKICMNNPSLQENPLIQKACERPTYLKRTQAWPPKSAESLSKVPLNVDELRKFIAIEYYMGLVKLPSMVHYWSLRFGDFWAKDIMSRDRFNAIKAMLSLESVEDTFEARDNNRHRKVGVWLDMFNERNRFVAQKYWTPEQLQSSMAIDEQSILCKSKMTAESQRMPNKPVKQGYKIFSINDSKTGYTYWFSCAMRTSSMTIHDRILNLVKGLPEGCRGSNIYMDNLFTTPDVLLELQKMDHGGAGTWRRQVPPPFAAGGKGIGKVNNMI